MAIRAHRVFFPAGREHYRTVMEDTGFVEIVTEQGHARLAIWALSSRRMIVSYSEGRVTTVRCDHEEEFVNAVEALERWANEHADAPLSRAPTDGTGREVAAALGLVELFPREPAQDAGAVPGGI